ncbi:hypothetical protein JW905_08030, partial [bacterium]|nr:hypothetical protein [candidate division CSSED10-310 bacterium]
MKRISAIFIVMVIAGMNSAVAQKERNHGQTPPGPSGKPSMWRGTGMQKFHEITDAKHRFQVESPGLGWRRQADSSFPLALFRDGTSV